MRYLLTGGSGVLGTELQKHLDCFTPNRDLMDITWTANEISSELYSQWIRAENTKSIIHCAAYTDVPGSEINKNKAIEANIIGTKNVKELANSFSVPMIYISTDYVYGGIYGNYRETDATEPFNFYGFTKLAGESYLDTEYDLVIRTSFKPNVPWPYEKAFYDLITSADYIDVIAPKIAKLIDSGARGIFNVGTEKKSVYNLAKRRNYRVKSASASDILDVKLPQDISMNLSKLKEWEQQNG